MAQISVHQPVNQLLHLGLDALGRIGYHPLLKAPPHPLDVNEVEDALQTDGVIEEIHPPRQHLVQDVLHVTEAKSEIAPHVLFVEAELAVYVVNGLQVLPQQAQALIHRFPVLASQPLGHTEGVQQLELDAALLVKGLQNITLQRGEAAGLPKAIPFRTGVGRLGLQGQPGREGEDLRREAQEVFGVLGDKAHHLLHVGFALQDVNLVEDDDHFFAPVADALQEDALALGEGTIGRGDEEDQITAWHKVLGDLFVAADDGVGTWRVHDVDLSQEIHWTGGHQNELFFGFRGRLITMLEDVNPGRCGRHPLGQEPLAQQGVDESRLARVELADGDQEEEFIQL